MRDDIFKAGFDATQPRDDFGRWVSAGSIAMASVDTQAADELRVKVTDPKERKKLDAALLRSNGYSLSRWSKELDKWIVAEGLNPDDKHSRAKGTKPLPSMDQIASVAAEQRMFKGLKPSESTLRSYAVFKEKLLSQYEALRKSGLEVYAWEGEGEPYKSPGENIWSPSSDVMRERVEREGKFYFFMTQAGFGSEGAGESAKHPLLEMSPVKTTDGKPMLYNDVFRVVHDAVGHVDGGFSFSTRGEFNAMLVHASTLPKESWAALFAETFGQNSVYELTKKFADQNVYTSEHLDLISDALSKSNKAFAFYESSDVDSDLPVGAGRLRRQLDSLFGVTYKDGALGQFVFTKEYKDGDGDGKIFDGTPREQAVQKKSPVDSPEFKAWFGDSKVVGPDDKPLVVYHGTSKAFDAFSLSVESATGHPSRELGVFFTESPHIADRFNRDMGTQDFADPARQPYRDGAAIMPVYLSIRNPKEMTDKEFRDLMVTPDYELRTPEQYRQLRASLESQGFDGIAVRSEIKKRGGIASPGLEEYAKDQFIAFNPTQIKSATGNSGKFDPNNAGIRKSFGREFDENKVVRDDIGRFADKASQAAAASDPQKAAALLRRVNRPDQRANLIDNLQSHGMSSEAIKSAIDASKKKPDAAKPEAPKPEPAPQAAKPEPPPKPPIPEQAPSSHVNEIVDAAPKLVAKLMEKGGFTYNPINDSSPATGFAVSERPESEAVMAMREVSPQKIIDWLIANRDALGEPNAHAHAGAWRNPEDGMVYLDVASIYDSEQDAAMSAMENGQLGIFDLAAGKTITTMSAEQRKQWEKDQADKAATAPTVHYAIADDPTTDAPPHTVLMADGIDADHNGDGVTDASRVGVMGYHVPNKIPRLKNLTSDERLVESTFADWFEQDPDGAAAAYRKAIESGAIGDGPTIYSVDDCKRLSRDYESRKENRSLYNLSVHQTANAIAKRAFLSKLDEIASKPEGERHVMVTAGGCGGGKGYACGKIPEVSELVAKCDATWGQCWRPVFNRTAVDSRRA